MFRANAQTENLDSQLNKIKTDLSQDIRAAVLKIMYATTDRKVYFNSPKDSAYIVSVALSFDHSGRTDTVFFSEKISDHTKKVLGLNSKLVELILEKDFTRFGYRNQVVLFPILFVQHYDKSIKLSPGAFLTDYINLWPNFGSALKYRELVLLEPYINRYGITHRN